MKFKQAYSLDAAKEVDGVWIELGDGGRIRVARQGNANAEVVTKDLLKPYKSMITKGRSLAPDVWKEIAVKIMARAILVDWSGIDDDDGNPLPYSIEAAEKMLRDYALFREDVAGYASDVSLFKDEEEAAAEKN